MDSILLYHAEKSLKDKNNDIIIKNLMDNSYNTYEKYVRACINYSIIPVVITKFKLYKNKC